MGSKLPAASSADGAVRIWDALGLWSSMLPLHTLEDGLLLHTRGHAAGSAAHASVHRSGEHLEAMPVPFADSYWQRKEVAAESPASLIANAGFLQSSWLTRNGGSRGGFAI